MKAHCYIHRSVCISTTELISCINEERRKEILLPCHYLTLLCLWALKEKLTLVLWARTLLLGWQQDALDLAVQSWSAWAPGVFKIDVPEYFAADCCCLESGRLSLTVTQLSFFKSLVNHMCVHSMDQITVSIRSVQILRTHFKGYSVFSSILHAFKSHHKRRGIGSLSSRWWLHYICVLAGTVRASCVAVCGMYWQWQENVKHIHTVECIMIICKTLLESVELWFPLEKVLTYWLWLLIYMHT